MNRALEQLELLRSKRIFLPPDQWRERLADIHPADLLEDMEDRKADPREILEDLPDEYIALVIDQAEDETKYNLLTLFPAERQASIIGKMSSNELADLLGSVDRQERDSIISVMNETDAAEMEELLNYPPESAGGIMATEYLAVTQDMTVGDTIRFLQKEAPPPDIPYYLYALDREDILAGVVSLRDVVVSSFDTPVGEIMNRNVIRVPVEMDQEEVGRLFEKYGLLSMPVVSGEGRMLGVIQADDIVEVLSEEHTEDLYRMAGLGETERIGGTVASSVRARLPWLLVNLLTAILASATVSLFQDTIGKVVALAVFMPIVAGMGGNAGTQTMTVIIRGLALGEVQPENARSILLKELSLGLIHGLSLGLVVSLLGYLWVGNPWFGLVLGAAMILNLIVAAGSGYLVPRMLSMRHIDPALASGVFVTTVTDVLGFFFFLGLASLLLPLLI